VVLLGFDGASPNLIDPLLARGELPNLQRLREQGACGALRSFAPTKSAILWTSVATGKTMLKHGIVDWTYVNRQGLQVPFAGDARRAKSYWEILAERRVTAGTLNWWLTYPPAPILEGYVVSNAFRHTAEAHTVHPRRLFDAINPLRVDTTRAPAEMRALGIPDWRAEDATLPLGNARQVLGAYHQYVAQDLTNDRVSDHLWEAQPVQVFSSYFRLVDVTSHFAVHFVDPEAHAAAAAAEREGRLTPEAEAKIDAALAEVVAPVYRFMDAVVGKYLARIDPRTLLIVCSDHGFRFYKGAYAHAHRGMQPPEGVLFLAGAGVRPGQRLTGPTLYDVAPTILWAMGQPVARDMDGAVLLPAFDARLARRFPVAWVPSYETREPAPGEARASDEKLDREALEDLRTLGYIGGEEKEEEAPR
jgi:predicted AlkP superfamily phosphohydrolase/phosphomutase